MAMTKTAVPVIRTRAQRLALLEPQLLQRVLVIDGAMGTMIQAQRLRAMTAGLASPACGWESRLTGCAACA